MATRYYNHHASEAPTAASYINNLPKAVQDYIRMQLENNLRKQDSNPTAEDVERGLAGRICDIEDVVPTDEILDKWAIEESFNPDEVKIEEAAWIIESKDGKQALFEAHLSDDEYSPNGLGWYFSLHEYHEGESDRDSSWVEIDGGMYWGYQNATELITERPYSPLVDGGPVQARQEVKTLQVSYELVEELGVYGGEAQRFDPHKITAAEAKLDREALTKAIEAYYTKENLLAPEEPNFNHLKNDLLLNKAYNEQLAPNREPVSREKAFGWMVSTKLTEEEKKRALNAIDIYAEESIDGKKPAVIVDERGKQDNQLNISIESPGIEYEITTVRESMNAVEASAVYDALTTSLSKDGKFVESLIEDKSQSNAAWEAIDQIVENSEIVNDTIFKVESLAAGYTTQEQFREQLEQSYRSLKEKLDQPEAYLAIEACIKNMAARADALYAETVGPAKESLKMTFPEPSMFESKGITAILGDGTQITAYESVLEDGSKLMINDHGGEFCSYQYYLHPEDQFPVVGSGVARDYREAYKTLQYETAPEFRQAPTQGNPADKRTPLDVDKDDITPPKTPGAQEMGRQVEERAQKPPVQANQTR